MLKASHTCSLRPHTSDTHTREKKMELALARLWLLQLFYGYVPPKFTKIQCPCKFVCALTANTNNWKGQESAAKSIRMKCRFINKIYSNPNHDGLSAGINHQSAKCRPQKTLFYNERYLITRDTSRVREKATGGQLFRSLCSGSKSTGTLHSRLYTQLMLGAFSEVATEAVFGPR